MKFILVALCALFSVPAFANCGNDYSGSWFLTSEDRTCNLTLTSNGSGSSGTCWSRFGGGGTAVSGNVAINGECFMNGSLTGAGGYKLLFNMTSDSTTYTYELHSCSVTCKLDVDDVSKPRTANGFANAGGTIDLTVANRLVATMFKN